MATAPGNYFLPHHAVREIDNGDVKLWVVFHASAKCPTGVCLNSVLYPGPKPQQDIADILIRFRLFRRAFATDICKMCRQVHRILPDPSNTGSSSPQAEFAEYDLNTYGVNCVLQSIARVILTFVMRHCYDIRRGADTVDWPSNRIRYQCLLVPAWSPENGRAPVVLLLQAVPSGDSRVYGVRAVRNRDIFFSTFAYISRVNDPVVCDRLVYFVTFNFFRGLVARIYFSRFVK